MSDIKTVVVDKMKFFIEWNKKNWNSGGKDRWKVIGLWVFVLAVLGSANKDESRNVQSESRKTEQSRYTSGSNSQDNRESSKNQISNIPWYEVDRIYNVKSNTTELQKDEEWKNLKGKRVQWSGYVSEISEGLFSSLTLQVKMNPSTFTSDVLIDLKRSEKEKVKKLSKDMYVTFTGTLDRWGSILPITMKDGELVN